MQMNLKNRNTQCLVTIIFIIVAGLFLTINLRNRRSDKLKNQLMRAVEEANYQQFTNTLREVMEDPDYGFSFDDEREAMAINAVFIHILNKWMRGEKLWSDANDKSTVFGIISLGRSRGYYNGSGLLDTDEGFQLASNVVEKVNNERKSSDSLWFVQRDSDGKVVAGLRSIMH
jgi:hypothetical protein